MPATANWEALSIQIPGQDFLEGTRNILETLMSYLEVLKAVLETVKVFLIDFGNPIKPLVEALIQLILDLFESLKLTGIYGWFDIPNPLVDPNLYQALGGYAAFATRLKAGLYDSRDPNRPQPVAGVSNGGFTIIVADAGSPTKLLHDVNILLQFLGKEFVTPQYGSPSIRVLPLGAHGDVILSVAKLFQQQPRTVVVEWTLPPATNPGDPGFSDLIQAFSTDLIPPSFLIEKSSVNPVVGTVDVSQLGVPEATGQVVETVPTVFENRGTPGDTISRQIRLNDQYGDPVIKFQEYIVIDSSTNTTSFLLGQLGAFRYIDSDVEPDKTYYYRVRSYSGELAVSGSTLGWLPPKTDTIDGTRKLFWPGAGGSTPVMGKASSIATITLPTYPNDDNFDVITNLQRLFQTAFSLNFHLPPPETPVDQTIGQGSLTSLAGTLTSFQAVPLVGDTVSSVTAVTAQFQPSAVTGRLPVPPWDTPGVQHNAARLATIVAGAILEANVVVNFQTLMTGPYPKGTPVVPKLTATTLSELVLELTKVQDPALAGQGGVQDAGVLYGHAFSNPQVRLNVLAAVNYCKSFTLGGAPPDWVQVSFLRDIVPWSGQMLYNLLAKMQALLDAYKGVSAEINVFIGLITRKIDSLEVFLEYLVSILDFVEGLSLGFYLLSVPSISGGVGEWVATIDSAGGDIPPSGPEGYTGGVAFAYVAPDVTAFANAFGLIF